MKSIAKVKTKLDQGLYREFSLTWYKMFGYLKKSYIFIVVFIILASSYCFVRFCLHAGGTASYLTNWVLLCGIIFSLICLINEFVVLPKIIGNKIRQDFDTNKLLQQPYEVCVFEDKILSKNNFTQYVYSTTEFTVCIESKTFFALAAQSNKNAVIIAKQDMTEAEIKKLSEFFQKEFCEKYKKL